MLKMNYYDVNYSSSHIYDYCPLTFQSIEAVTMAAEYDDTQAGNLGPNER